MSSSTPGRQSSRAAASARCTLEPGYECPPGVPGDTMFVPIVYRDFLTQHADFEPGATGRITALTGMVQPDLDANGKPVFTGVSRRLHDGGHIRRVVPRHAWRQPHDGRDAAPFWRRCRHYGNRYGPNGEQWQTTTTAFFCGVAAPRRSTRRTASRFPARSRSVQPIATRRWRWDTG